MVSYTQKIVIRFRDDVYPLYSASRAIAEPVVG